MRTKSIRYRDAQSHPLLIQSGKDFFDTCKGHWNTEFFGNDYPITLELACGRGEYTVGLAKHYPDRNFVGVDIKGERMMIGLKRYQESCDENPHLPHAKIGFLRTIIHHLDRFFGEGEVADIWLIHPDPRPKGHDERRRLTAPRFLNLYHKILRSDGILRLRTDDDDFFAYSIEQLGQHHFECIDLTWDLDNSPLVVEHHDIETHYGRLFKDQGKTIKYGKWRKK